MAVVIDTVIMTGFVKTIINHYIFEIVKHVNDFHDFFIKLNFTSN